MHGANQRGLTADQCSFHTFGLSAGTVQVSEEFNVAVVITNQVSSGAGLALCRAAVAMLFSSSSCPAPTCLLLTSYPALLQVISDPSGGAMFVADPKKPGGRRCSRTGCCTHAVAAAPGARATVDQGSAKAWLRTAQPELLGFPAHLHTCLTTASAVLLHLPHDAVGGHVLAHASTFRLSVRKGKAEQRLMKVRQGPPNGAAAVVLVVMACWRGMCASCEVCCCWRMQWQKASCLSAGLASF